MTMQTSSMHKTVIAAMLVASFGGGCANPGTTEYEQAKPSDIQVLPSAGDATSSASEPDMATQSATVLGEQFDSKYSTFTRAAYDAELVKGHPVLLYIFSNTSAESQKQDPVVQEVFKAKDVGVMAYRVHFGDNVANAEQKAFTKSLNVTQEHQFILIDRNGKEVARQAGSMNLAQLHEFILKVK